MKTLINPSIDRSIWGNGLWNGEPDKAQWIDEATGLDCLIVRVPHSGHLCGYVGVPPGHRFHGKEYDDVPADVHGGLTFADACQEGEEFGICHVPEAGRPDHVWWLGFDCAHCHDVTPFSGPRGWFQDESYKTLDFVRSECTALAAQLI